MQDTVRFVIDDRIEEIRFGETSAWKPVTTVLNWLRSHPNHRGVKEGCAEGDCGACTVVLAEPDKAGRLVYRAVDSCLVFLPALHGKQLITVEHLAYEKERRRVLHPVQEAILRQNGTQCGFCTPGIVMSLFGLYKNHHNPSEKVIRESLAGNLCRCTGYRSILDAAREVCAGSGIDHFSATVPMINGLLGGIRANRETLVLRHEGLVYYKPFTLEEALRLRKSHPGAILTGGATDVALRQTKKRETLAEILDLSAVEELRLTGEEGDGFLIGAGLPLEDIRTFFHDRIPALSDLLGRFGSLQIRHVATLGGNLGSASPIGDLLPFLMACRARVILASPGGERTLPVEEFITGYRRTALGEDEIILSVFLPKKADRVQLFSHKVSKRKDVDISTVSGAFLLELERNTVREIILAFGGMAAVPKRATGTERFLTGSRWEEKQIDLAAGILEKEFTPLSDARSGASYRTRVSRNLLKMFYRQTTGDSTHDFPMEPPGDGLPAHPDPDATPRSTREDSSFSTSFTHVTGESVFITDLPAGERLLSGVVLYSPHAHARILKLDATEARSTPGTIAVVTAEDIPGANQMGPVIHDEPCLAASEVTFVGQAVALVAAETEEIAREAAKKIVIEYEPLPALTSLADAMEAGNLLAPPRMIRRGTPEEIMKTAPHVIRGELSTGAQEHWYLETQSALAVPGEGNETVVHASSQNPSETQAIVAEVLGIRRNDVEVEVKRIGGGFGGKETQGNHVAAWAALLAKASGYPVRLRLFRDDDQIMTGKRHRFLSRYEAAFDDEGRILAWIVELNADAGAATDLSRAILERAMLHADNAYYLPHACVTGQAWKTNLPSNTAFRGFGGPQGMAVIENAIDRIARELKRDPADIRRINFYGPERGETTPYGQTVENNRLHMLFDRISETSGYRERRAGIDRFNADHRFHKKGMALTPVKFGISFTTSFLNQAGALVHLYTDGTVLVNHGGTEMGQGLHDKILRITAEELGVCHDRIRIAATNTSKVPNTSPTAASSGSDLNGMAVKNAIDTLKERLAPVALELLHERFPGQVAAGSRLCFAQNGVFPDLSPDCRIPFSELCNTARTRQVSLSATGFYSTPGIWFDRDGGQGKPFYYFAYGMAVSEVIIDLHTGEHRLLRTDILHDAGDSIDEAVDIGQVEGGFVQGMGWCTTEEVKWDEAGRQLTHSPDTYKIPTIGDIPPDFRVHLMENVPNPGTIRRSKAVGEPPFMLGLSVWLAIKDAVSAAAGHRVEPPFSLPATGEVILEAVETITAEKTGTDA